jgi:hypothetical protein
VGPHAEKLAKALDVMIPAAMIAVEMLKIMEASAAVATIEAAIKHSRKFLDEYRAETEL